MKFPFRERKISGPIKFLHIGYFHPIKDQITLFKAFAKVSDKVDCSLTIVGAGFNNFEVHTLLESLSIANRVIFEGEKRQPELLTYYRDAHILIHTSRYEAECAVVQEAMASGLPVVSTRVGIMADLGERYGMVAEPEDVDGLVEKILHLANDADLYTQIQENAFEFISAHDVNWSSSHFRNYVMKVIGERLEVRS